MPNNAPAIKREATAALGADIVLVGPGSTERQLKAEELAAEHGYIIVPPYNDEYIIAGQGTMGLEILEDMPDVETVLAPVGGGGLISGVAAAIKMSKPEVNVFGVEPELAADAQASLRAGKIVNFPADQVTRTLADGLRTQSVGAINFDHMQCFVDGIITVTEDEIREAMKLLSANPSTVAEPSGAVATAGFLFHANQLPKTKLNVAIISGGNIEPQMLAEIRGGSNRARTPSPQYRAERSSEARLNACPRIAPSPAAKRRKNTAHSASCGSHASAREQAPKGRKNDWMSEPQRSTDNRCSNNLDFELRNA